MSSRARRRRSRSSWQSLPTRWLIDLWKASHGPVGTSRARRSWARTLCEAVGDAQGGCASTWQGGDSAEPAEQRLPRGSRGLGESSFHIGYRASRGARTVSREFDDAFAQLVRGGAHGVVVQSDSMFVADIRRLGELCAAHRVPGAGSDEFCEGGGLLAYGVNFPALWRRAPYFVDKILKGAKPADIPVEQPTTFDLVVNLEGRQSPRHRAPSIRADPRRPTHRIKILARAAGCPDRRSAVSEPCQQRGAQAANSPPRAGEPV